MGNITMSRKECNQVAVFERLKQGVISVVLAAQMLHLSTRQIRNKRKRYETEGAQGLAHRARGKPGNRAWNEKVRKKALALIKEHYHDFGPTFAAEKLDEVHAIKISNEALRKAMIKAGIWRGKKRKVKYRERRIRKPVFGIMVQLDGSEHDWFEGRAPKCTLLVFIDDATSEVVWAKFVTGESLENLLQATYEYFSFHGLPASIYADKAGVFRVNNKNDDDERFTQYHRALDELGVRLIHAHSAQAKGRVERVNDTLQDRLIKEMRLAGISSMEAGNAFLQNVYLPKHNAKFAVAAAKPGNAHRPIKGYDLDNILCKKEKRVLTNDFTISYCKRILQIKKTHRVIVRPKDDIIVQERLDDSLMLFTRGKRLEFVEIKQRPCKPKQERIYSNVYHRPAANHPWRKGPSTTPNGGYLSVV
jgi:hypothetical protein